MSSLGSGRWRRQPVLVVLALLGLLLGGMLSCPALVDTVVHTGETMSSVGAAHDGDHSDHGHRAHCGTDSGAVDVTDARSVDRGQSTAVASPLIAASGPAPAQADVVPAPSCAAVTPRSGRVLLAELVVSRT